MFEKLTKIGNDIYVYKNFLSKKNLEEYNYFINNINENDWIDAKQFNKPGMHTYTKPEFGKILKKINDEIMPDDIYLEGAPSINRIMPGFDMEEHVDECPHCRKIKNPDEHIGYMESKRCVLYGIVVYLSKFSGGEIYYPAQDVSFQPEPGDLIIHSTSKECKHGVRTVIDGNRYVMAPYAVKYLNEKDAMKAKTFWESYSYKFEKE
jgi:hypothetical protein